MKYDYTTYSVDTLFEDETLNYKTYDILDLALRNFYEDDSLCIGYYLENLIEESSNDSDFVFALMKKYFGKENNSICEILDKYLDDLLSVLYEVEEDV